MYKYITLLTIVRLKCDHTISRHLQSSNNIRDTVAFSRIHSRYQEYTLYGSQRVSIDILHIFSNRKLNQK